MINLEFHQILRSLIEEHNITQKQLAADLNIAASTVGSYVQGVREPDFSILMRLAEYFHVSTDYLLGYRLKSNITPQEENLLQIFRALSREQQELYLEQGKAFLKVNRKEKYFPSTFLRKNNIGYR